MRANKQYLYIMYIQFVLDLVDGLIYVENKEIVLWAKKKK